MKPEIARDRTQPATIEPHPGESGAVFTPPIIARRLVDGLDELAPGVRRYLDPACGDGSLLAAALAAHSTDPDVARDSLFGIDIDPRFVDAARQRIRRLVREPRALDLERRIVCRDALDDPASWPRACIVIANPPWVSFSGREAVHGQRRRRSRLGGWPSLQGDFLETIARYVGANGTAARLLIPGSVTELERYGPLRGEVTRWARVLGEPIELGDTAFRDVVEPAVILTLVPRADGEASSSAPWTVPDAWTVELTNALDRFPRLPRGAFADPGVHTGNSSADLIDVVPRSGWARVRQGRDLAPFQLGEGRAWLRTDLERTPDRRFRVGSVEHFQAFPILLRQTANRPIAAVHTDPGYFRNSLLACRGTPDLDPYFLTAILNGPVAAAWHRSRFRDARQRSFPQVKVAHLASQPFPIAHRAEARELHDRLASLSRRAEDTAARSDSLLRELSVTALRAFRLPSDLEAKLVELA
jgi:hypothetical protein